MNILLIGSGAREHAMARAIKRSSQNHELVCIGTNNNPGIMSLSSIFTVRKITDSNAIVSFAEEHNVDLTIIGPEAPLETGVSDALWSANIPTVGPKQALAQIETSKAFARKLFTKYHIPACPQFRVFTQMEGVKKFLQELGENYVVKADGLMGGKGVKVSGEHLQSHKEALEYCKKLLVKDGQFVLEEKLIGEEFSLMSFCDGKNLAHMPPVQDHKRAYVGDEGPNTGGMGSYSDANHLLPFLTREDVTQARQFNEATIEALKKEFGMGYKGILYGGFIVTTDGVKLIEYNARLGDPEGMNVLSILESDFITICWAIVIGTLTQEHARFSNLATVCKYAVPEGYPDSPVKGEKIDISKVADKAQLYYASVESRGDELFEAGSRTVAFVGIAETLPEAEAKAEEEISRVRGPLFHRIDIGTNELVKKRIDHMNGLRV
ncbi:MAG: phosphoribosylamine--glycine ligase [Candidatus Marinimicrobia bacterium]|nr:phosphoribosylamine--glycine ligase [Candidatus Neomarinimicrobiota bacterium]